MLFLFQIAVGDLAGVSQQTVSRVVTRVTRVLGELYNEEVTFPTSQQDRAKTMRDFYAIAQFPAVLGAIDCTHIAIQSPGGDTGELFRNRKGYFSLNVQAVVNANLLFENVVSRWHGSVHDATIFSSSRLYARFETGEIQGGYLLGDAGYPCKPYLLTPLGAPTTRAEQNYNYAQIRTRNPVERAFGVLKRRFPCLRMGLRVKVTPEFCRVNSELNVHHKHRKSTPLTKCSVYTLEICLFFTGLLPYFFLLFLQLF